MNKVKTTKTMKGKVKETVNEVKEVLKDNKGFFIVNGVAIVFIVGGIVVSRQNSKKYEALWRAAMKAYENGNLDHDFGPYKVMKFFEPKTGEFIGKTVIHEDCMKMFLKIK